MNSYFELWFENPILADKITDIALFFIGTFIIGSVVFFRWRKECKRVEKKEKALQNVIEDLCEEPRRNLKELKDNMKESFGK